jgi:hypothetical protein
VAQAGCQRCFTLKLTAGARRRTRPPYKCSATSSCGCKRKSFLLLAQRLLSPNLSPHLGKLNSRLDLSTSLAGFDRADTFTN